MLDMEGFATKLQHNIVRGLERSLNRKPLSRGDFRRTKIRRILIVCDHNNLGDLLLATPVFRAVRQNFPVAYIAVVVKADLADVLIGNIFVNAVILFYQRWRQWTPRRLVHFLKRVRSKYDLAIVLNVVSHSLPGDLIAFLSRARYVLGSEYPLLPGASWNFFYNLLASYSQKNRHLTERHLDIVRYLDIDTNVRTEVINLSKDEKAWAEVFFAEHGLASDDLIVAIHIGADDIGKQWEVKKFVQVAKYLTTHHRAKIIVSWGECKEDLGREFLNGLPFPAVILSGLPVRHLAATIYFADVMVCNDCDLMHVAASVGTSLVAIFCNSPPEESKPIGEEFVALKAKSSGAIGIDIVIESVLKLMEDHPKRQRFDAENFDISDEVLKDYLDILNTFDE